MIQFWRKTQPDPVPSVVPSPRYAFASSEPPSDRDWRAWRAVHLREMELRILIQGRSDIPLQTEEDWAGLARHRAEMERLKPACDLLKSMGRAHGAAEYIDRLWPEWDAKPAPEADVMEAG